MSKTIRIRNLTIGPGTPKIIVPIAGVTKEEILSLAERVKDASPDLIEWRADWYEDTSEFDKVQDIMRCLRSVMGEIPILFTFRSAGEGGEKDIDRERYASLNRRAAASGIVDLIDVESAAGDEIVKELIAYAHMNDVKVVASSHDFHKTPEKDAIVSRLRKMNELGCDIPKIAVMPTCRADVITLLDATQEADSVIDKPIVTMSMSEIGLISRLAGETFGSALTFGAVGKASAPGQMNAEDLRTILDLIHYNSRTHRRS